MHITRLITICYGLLLASALLVSCGGGNPAAPGEDDNTSGGGSESAKVQVKVVNRLFSTVNLSQDGRSLGTISRLDSMEVKISPLAGKPLRWTMEAITGGTGAKMGETISGHFFVENEPGGERRFEVSNVVGDRKYFALLLGNSTSTELMFGINMGLPEPDNRWEKKCYCPLSARSPLIYVGYYRLLPDSNIRVYRYGPEYAGPYNTWLRFSEQVDDRAGIILLNVYAVPAGAPIEPASSLKGITAADPAGILSSAVYFH